jgi:hypothetical protein
VQGRAADAQRQIVDLESRLVLLERAVRDSDAAALDWQARAREAELSRAELEQVARSSEAAAKQVRWGMAGYAPLCDLHALSAAQIGSTACRVLTVKCAPCIKSNAAVA